MRLTRRLLGTDVRGCPRGCIKTGPLAQRADLGVNSTGDTEISQPRMRPGDQNVLGLHVAVNHTCVVGVLQAFGERADQRDDGVDFHGA